MSGIEPSGLSSPGAKQRVPRYRLYIDESGDHTYNKLDDLGIAFLPYLVFGLGNKKPTSNLFMS